MEMLQQKTEEERERFPQQEYFCSTFLNERRLAPYIGGRSEI
jgi:hypothetical protein